MPTSMKSLKRMIRAAAILACSGLVMAAPAAFAEEAIYSATRTISVPPASNFKTGGGGGDGWAIALSKTSVYNVYHHSETLTVACHEQSNGHECFSAETIKDGEGHNFATSGHPGLYLDEAAGRLYVYATRGSDETAGVVCIDTSRASEEPNPFCGYTPLTPPGEGPLEFGEVSGTGTPMLLGTRWYAFNQVDGANINGARNKLLCFDVSVDSACAGQPFEVPLGEGNVNAIYPGPPSATIGSKLVIPLMVEGHTRIACFDGATQTTCAGSWPLAPEGVEYAGRGGSPFPLLDSTAKLVGFCVPTGTDQCYTLTGAQAETPAAMPSVIGANDAWNGPGLVIGPRVYVPTGEGSETGSGYVQCFDYATGAGCPHFPREFTNLYYLYTVTADPQRPSCIWVNADGGEAQIQDFDAYTGEACGIGPVRGLGTQFIAPGEQCIPNSYISLNVLQPGRGGYTSGTVTFTDGDGEPLTGLEGIPLSANGDIDLTTMGLNSPTGLPQFLFGFAGLGEELGSIEAQLTWRATYAASCAGEGRTITRLGEPSREQRPQQAVQVPATPAALACTAEQVALTNVVEHGSRVRIEGAARLKLAGRKVSIKLTATGKTVAIATVASDGTFTAIAPLPPRGIRRTNQARYQAAVGRLVSPPLKLARRMYMTRARTVSGGVLLQGDVKGRFIPGTPVSIYLRQTCSHERVVAHTRLTRTGVFTVLAPGPSQPAGQIDLYRASTEVLRDGRPVQTWTLPTPPGSR
jgi:hypothetical protein